VIGGEIDFFVSLSEQSNFDDELRKLYLIKEKNECFLQDWSYTKYLKLQQNCKKINLHKQD
jgi:hypothetical protein